MDDHAVDRWAAVLAHRRHRASRRRFTGGLLGGLAGALGLRNNDVAALRAPSRQDCSLGCTSSICGEMPVDCPLFPADNIWNTPVDSLPVDARSEA